VAVVEVPKAERLRAPVVPVVRTDLTELVQVEPQEVLEALTVEQSMPVVINLQAAAVAADSWGVLPETFRALTALVAVAVAAEPIILVRQLALLEMAMEPQLGM
jgi:hypothetical protein